MSLLLAQPSGLFANPFPHVYPRLRLVQDAPWFDHATRSPTNQRALRAGLVWCGTQGALRLSVRACHPPLPGCSARCCHHPAPPLVSQFISSSQSTNVGFNLWKSRASALRLKSALLHAQITPGPFRKSLARHCTCPMTLCGRDQARPWIRALAALCELSAQCRLPFSVRMCLLHVCALMACGETGLLLDIYQTHCDWKYRALSGRPSVIVLRASAVFVVALCDFPQHALTCTFR